MQFVEVKSGLSFVYVNSLDLPLLKMNHTKLAVKRVRAMEELLITYGSSGVGG